MAIKGMRRAVIGAVGAAAMLMAGMAQAALQDRDLNGDSVTDAFYDTDLNITWLRNANLNGLMHFECCRKLGRRLQLWGLQRLAIADKRYLREPQLHR